MLLQTIVLGGSEIGTLSQLFFFLLFPACRNLSPLFAEEGCRFPSIHALHAANMEPVWTRFSGYEDDISRFSEVGIFSPLVFFFLFPACRNLSPLLAEEGCRFPSIHALHAANMEPVRMRFGGSTDNLSWWF